MSGSSDYHSASCPAQITEELDVIPAEMKLLDREIACAEEKAAATLLERLTCQAQVDKCTHVNVSRISWFDFAPLRSARIFSTKETMPALLSDQIQAERLKPCVRLTRHVLLTS